MPTLITLDTEFIEDGRTIDLVSLGLVRDDGATYYAEPLEADHTRASDWVRTNVLAHLEGGKARKTRPQIAQEVQSFAGHNPQFWAWYADYDWVALCQLFGTMLDLPNTWPMFCRDFRQVADPTQVVKHDPYLDGPEHHALSDARWLMRAIKSYHGEQ